jgi:hypothetical protein
MYIIHIFILPGTATTAGNIPTGVTTATPSTPVGRCPALQLETVEPECIFQGRRVSCLDSVAPGTEAKLSCKAFHSAEPEFSRITCRENGQWNRQPYVCKPGKSIVFMDKSLSFSFTPLLYRLYILLLHCVKI